MEESVDLLHTKTEAWIREAVELRRTIRLPSYELGTAEAIESLSCVRQALDRVEALMVTATRLRAEVARRSETATAIAQDAWDEAAKNSRIGEYSSARERAADANLRTLGQLRDQRQRAEQLSIAKEAVDILYIIHRGIDGIRMDLHRVLGSMTVQRSLEH